MKSTVRAAAMGTRLPRPLGLAHKVTGYLCRLSRNLLLSFRASRLQPGQNLQWAREVWPGGHQPQPGNVPIGPICFACFCLMVSIMVHGVYSSEVRTDQVM